MKTYVRTEVYNHAEQKIIIQPTPEFNGMMLFYKYQGQTEKNNVIVINIFWHSYCSVLLI